MEKAKLSAFQLFILMFIFNLGTSLIVSYGITAGKDDWIAILLGMCGGIVLFFVYYGIFRSHSNLTFRECISKILGVHLGWILSLLYCLIFFYIAARNVRDFTDILVSSTLTTTPLLAITITFILVICYVLYLGIEVMGRAAEIFFVVLLLFGIVANFFVLVSGDFQFNHIRPPLERGWIPIFTTAFPTIIAFPYGEMIVFMVLLPYLNKLQLARKSWLSAIISSGLILSWTAFINMTVLGSDVMERTTFPTLATIGKVTLFDFIERLDAIVVLTLLLTVFVKAAIFLYAATIGIVDLFKLKSHQQIIFPMGAILIFISMAIASSFSEHMEEGFEVAIKYVHIPFFVIIPFLLLIIATIQNVIKKT